MADLRHTVTVRGEDLPGVFEQWLYAMGAAVRGPVAVDVVVAERGSQLDPQHYVREVRLSWEGLPVAEGSR